jgi:hypothetical protein
MRAALILACLAVAAAGAARAQSLPARPEADASAPAIRMPQALILGPTAEFVMTANDRDSQPARPKGTVQTAVDHRFSERALGSLGYLCGLGEMASTSGGVASSFEPVGTFLGGQLKMAF